LWRLPAFVSSVFCRLFHSNKLLGLGASMRAHLLDIGFDLPLPLGILAVSFYAIGFVALALSALTILGAAPSTSPRYL